MPTSKEDRLRAKRLGLCIECLHLPSIEGMSRCIRCRETHRLRDQRRKVKKSINKRLQRLNSELLANYGREVAFALAHGLEAPPPPILATEVPFPWKIYKRLRKWVRRKPKKRYKYTPRPLPKGDTGVVQSYENQEVEGLSSGLASCVDPLAPQLGCPPSSPIKGDAHEEHEED